MTSEIIVLGAGIIGVCTALHLQERGAAVTIIDRNPPGEGASFGNAGLIERCSVIPYAIPRDWRTLLSHALNRHPSVRYTPAFLPKIAPWLWGYWRASHPEKLKIIGGQLLPLIESCLDEHARLAEAAGLDHLLKRDGWIEIIRSQAALDEAGHRVTSLGAEYGLAADLLDRSALSRLEPSLGPAAIGGIHWRDPFTVSDPGALTKGYAALFQQRGGFIARETIVGIAREGSAWRVTTNHANHRAEKVVVALGAHSNRILAPLGLKVPLVAKRGHHLHYPMTGNAALKHAILDEEVGYVLAPMASGIRLTTGVELAEPDAPPNRKQIDRCETRAREILPLGAPVEATPWLGLRPAMPDMKPVIGAAPGNGGLWLAFGHAHHGLTLGPSTGRLLAELMSGEKPFVDPRPFDITRFL